MGVITCAQPVAADNKVACVMDAKFRVILIMFLRDTGIAQAKLSEAAGFSRSVVGNVINGYIDLTPNIANKLADAMLELAG